jgi:hypothetical protein
VQVDKETLRARIRRAFADVPIPTRIEEMRLPRHTNDDSYDMAAAFVGKRWTEIPIETLFFHRESLAALSPEAYRAYLPAYLEASFASEDWLDKYGADIRQYLLFTLKHWPHQTAPERGAETNARLSALDEGQRAAIADVLQYLASRWNSTEAAEVLRDW